jgi:hypothetical protein
MAKASGSSCGGGRRSERAEPANTGAVAVAGDVRHWPILGGFQAAGCVAGMWVDGRMVD